MYFENHPVVDEALISAIAKSLTTCHEYLSRDHNSIIADDDTDFQKCLNSLARSKQDLKILEGIVMKENSTTEKTNLNNLKTYFDNIEEEMNLVNKMKHSIRISCQKGVKTQEFNKELEEKQSKLIQVGKMIQNKEKNIDSIKSNIDKMNDCIDIQKIKLDEMQNVFATLKPNSSIDEDPSNSVLTILPFIEDALMLKDNYINEYILALKFLHSPSHESSLPCLTLSIHFAENENCLFPYSITTVETNLESFRINDLAEKAKKNNNFATLISDVRNRWLYELPLMQEIFVLQNKYNIEWLKEERLVKTALPSGKIFVLRVPENYSEKRSAKLEYDNINTLKLGADCSLSSWLNYLHETF